MLEYDIIDMWIHKCIYIYIMIMLVMLEMYKCMFINNHIRYACIHANNVI